ncbi:contact-dependent growth inhibition system immunity protein [Streptomyces camelliae]|uniref:Contact-dependent growth inhibition system immunity protein n=1 Tax=Streptomyces camelliae TaxID=3004093 RepID=A0ABY7P4A4_9ACTN|nr:contact-dependent growth inhibition system immunity protein [Streptomyces sp. HUAS 2-6]WBO65378.1 contact-dependent growth inhibition system immunity protein [Streptomyces sp. HUAS 2-6]
MTALSDDRFHELSRLLSAYESTGEVFDDTLEAPGRALNSYLRTAARTPDRAAAAVREIDDLLEVGLFSDEIAGDVDLLPHIEPPRGASVEDCLRVVRHHLSRYLTAPPAPDPTIRPQTSWEWRERFPALAHFLGAYFYQDSLEIEYHSHAEAMDDYLTGELNEDLEQAASEATEFLTLNPSEDELGEAASVLGLREPPPDGISLRRWLTDIQGIIRHHLRTHP